MKTEVFRDRFPCVPLDSGTRRTFFERSNYLPGNGIRRDVTRTPRRRPRLLVMRPEKILGSSDPHTVSGSPGYWADIPSGRRRPDQLRHNCTSCKGRQQFSVPNRTLMAPFLYICYPVSSPKEKIWAKIWLLSKPFR